MDVREEKVLLSPAGYGRVAIVRRSDGLFCLYQHWRWTAETQKAPGVEIVADRRWTTEFDPALYEDVDPLPGIYGTMDDAEHEARRIIEAEGGSRPLSVIR